MLEHTNPMQTDRTAAAARSRHTRRQVLRRVGAAGLGLGLLPLAPRPAQAHGETASTVTNFADVSLPPDRGQADVDVYVEATGHTLRGTFLDYWRANGAASVYGNPISEPFATSAGLYSQAFENGVFQYRAEFLDTVEPIVRLMPIGQLALDARGDRPRTDGRRQAGVSGEITGPTISGDIRAWYDFNEGPFYLGAPLSKAHTERGATAQWFEGGLLTAGANGVALAPLVTEFAARLGIDTAPVARGERPLYDELLFWTADNPNPLGDPYAPGAKWIEVSIGEQRLWAYHGDTLISTTLVSTGLDPNLTEWGLFRVRLKYPEQDLQGFTDATGEVLGFGAAPLGTIPYKVKDVPHVMYFNLDAEALHGTYWHANFGQKMSHGCVNLPLDVAEWLYGWAPLGTGVWVHD